MIHTMWFAVKTVPHVFHPQLGINGTLYILYGGFLKYGLPPKSSIDRLGFSMK